MSLAEKLYIEKKTPYYGGGEVTWRISLYEEGYAGDPIAMTGQASPFRLRYEGDDSKRDIFEPIHEATLSMRFKIRSESQRTMLQDMFGSDENQHQLILSRNGEVVLKSAMLTDLADVSEGPVPFNAELKGKVIARTKGQDFPMSGQKVTVAQLLAELFYSLGYDFGIREITDWMEANTADGAGLFGQVYVDKYMLREFASNADEVNKPIKSKDILSQLMRRFSAHLLPWKRWNVIQPDALANATVDLYDYDTAGAAGSVQSGQNIDKAVSKAAGFYLLPSSGSNQVGGIKRSKLVFNHRSKTSQPDFSNDFILYPGDNPQSITASFASDGSQYVKFSGKATVHFDSQYLREQANGYIEITIHAGSYYFDGNGWVSGPARVKYTVNQLLVKQNVTIDFDITTPPAPADADGPLILQVSNYSYDASSPSNEWLRYQDLSFNIVNGDIAKGDNKKVEKRLESPREFSLEHDQGELYLGDGPTIYARSSLLTYNATQGYYVHTANWLRKGDAAGINIDELTLREINNLLRSGRKLLRAELLADYEPTQILVYAGKRFMFLFGELDGGSGKWRATFVELKRETDADELTEYYDTDGVESGSAPSTGSVTGSSKDGGVTDHGDMTGLEDDDHTQYVHVSKARAVSAIHNYQNGFKVGGSTFVDSQQNISANKGTFADVISSEGNIIAFSSGGGSSPAPSTVSYDTVNVATQINLRGKALFNSNDMIPASLIDGPINGGTADSVAWADVTGKPSTASEWATETGFDGRYALSSDLSSHVNSTANPHLVTASQVGLSNVENKALSTATWADLGIAKTDVSASDVGLGSVPNSNNLSAFVNGPGYYKSGDSPTFAGLTTTGNADLNSIDIADSPFVDSSRNVTTTLLTSLGEGRITTDKNKRNVIVDHDGGELFVVQTAYWDGAQWLDESYRRGYGVGENALLNNTGDRSNGFGSTALENNTGDYSNGFGHYALRYNTGTRSNGFGYFALQNNAGNYSNGFGFYALESNTGIRSNGFGYAALRFNQGDNNTAIGHNAGYDATAITGGDNTFLGANSTYDTSGGVSTITNATAVGANIVLTDSNTVILGNNANVGIGTTSPSSLLDVNGLLTARGGATISGLGVGVAKPLNAGDIHAGNEIHAAGNIVAYSTSV